jgi:hypothetical protein
MKTTKFQQGFHHILIVFIVVAVLVGLLGYAAYNQISNAAVGTAGKLKLPGEDCRWKLGRHENKNGVCQKKCESTKFKYVVGSPYDFCKPIARKLTQKQCVAKDKAMYKSMNSSLINYKNHKGDSYRYSKKYKVCYIYG